MNGEIKMDVIQRLLENKSSDKVMLSSLDVFKFSKKNVKKQILLYIVALVPSVLMGVAMDTQVILKDSIQLVLDVLLALFGIVFTGYSFFQALINKELLVRMVENTVCDKRTGVERSKLQETNESFVECMMLNLISIVSTLLIAIIVNCVPNDFLCFERLVYNNILVIALISFYFYFILTTIWEVKSFIFNIFQLFNIYAGTRIVELFKNQDNK